MRSGFIPICASRITAWWVTAWCITACATAVQSSSFNTGPALAPGTGRVAVSATRDPAGAEELGVVEAHGRRPQAELGELVAELQGRVSAMGGNFARIDSFASRYETITEQYTYDCGHDETHTETRTVWSPGAGGTSSAHTETVQVTQHVSKTCTGTREVEAVTFTLVGRAFRTR